MFRRFSANIAVISIFLDGLLIGLALFAASSARQSLNALPFVREVGNPVQTPWPLYLIFPVLWIGVLLLFSVYDGRRNLRLADEFGSLTLGSLLAVVAMAGVLYLSFRDVSRFLFLSFSGLSILLLLLWRLGLRLVFRWDAARGAQRRKVLILGAGAVGRKFQEQMAAQPYLGLALVGFLDDDTRKKREQPYVLGNLDDARQVVQDERVDDVVIALPRSADARLNQMVTELHDLPVRVWVIPDYFSLTLHRASVEEFAGLPMLDLRAPALSEYQRMVKRTFDLVIALLLMIPGVVIMTFIAVCIRVESPGPAFFRQKRMGENGRIFDIIKFRTMVADAETMAPMRAEHGAKGNPLHKVANDPRITRVGRFLRRTSLDEIPQLLNVIRGEMSLVGPRPEMVHLVEEYEPWQRKRFAVPQGMTGWWQINGRSDKPMHLHTDEDLYYVQHYSIWLDLQILVRTVWVVFRGKGAF